MLHFAPATDRRSLAQELDRRDADMSALAGAAQAAASTIDPVSEVCAVAARVLDADLAAVLLADDLGGLRLAGLHGRSWPPAGPPTSPAAFPPRPTRPPASAASSPTRATIPRCRRR